MDKLRSYAIEQLVRNAATTGQLQRAARYVPPPAPAPVRSSGGLKAGTPVNTPPVSRGVSGAIKQVYTPPPPPTITERVTQAFLNQPEARQQLAARLAPPPAPVGASIKSARPTLSLLPPVQPVTMGFQTATESVPQDDEPYTLYELPSGQDVVMPSSYNAPDDWQVKAELTDPNARQNAKESPIWWENAPTEIQAQIQQPGDQPSLSQVANPDQPLWIGDDQARQQEELANQDQAAQVVTDEYRERLRRATPVTMASDFAREQEQVANQRAAAQRVASTDLLSRVVNRGQNATPIAQDIARLQQEIEPQLPAASPDEPREWVIVRSERDGTIRAVRAEEVEDNPYLGPVQVIGSPITEDQAATINANPELTEPSPDTGEATGDDRQVSVRNIYEEVTGNTWGNLWEDIGQWAEEDVAPIFTQIIERFEKARPQGVTDTLDVGELQPVRTGLDIIKATLTAVPDDIRQEVFDHVTTFIAASLAGTKVVLEDIRQGDYSDIAARTLKIVDGVMDASMPFGDMTVREALGRVFNALVSKPQEYTVEQVIEAWYLDQTGIDNRDGGRTRPISVILSTMGMGILGATTSFPEWLEANQDTALAAYDTGVDTNGDGGIDLTGPDAVLWQYQQDAGAFDYLMLQLFSDPANWAMFSGVAGRLIGNLGAKIAESGIPVVRTLGKGIETTGDVVRIGGRAYETSASLGLDFAVDAALRGRILERLIPSSRGQIIRETTEGADAVTGAVADRIRIAAPDPGEVVDVARGADGAVTGITMGDGTTVRLSPEDAARITRELDPSKATNADTLALYRNLKDRGVNVDNVPPRWLKPIDDIVEQNPGRLDDINRRVDELTPAMQHHVISMQAAYGSGRSFPDAAIDTSRATDTWRKVFADDGLAMSDYVMSTPRQSNSHVLAETIIHTDWSSAENISARSQLYKMVGTEDGVQKSLGVGDAAAIRAERYADLVDEHLRWNPDAMDSEAFRKAYQEAQEIRSALADRGIRPRNSYSRRPSRTTGTKTKGSDTSGPSASSATSDGATPSQGRGTSTGEATPQTGGAREIPIPRGTEVRGEVDGYPIIARRTVEGVTEEGIQVAENVRVAVRPVEADFEARATNTLTNESGEWLRDPTKEGALNLAIEDARARGWMDEVAPAETPPATVAPEPEAPPTPASTAVSRGIAASDDTFENVRRLYRLSDEDMTEFVDILDTARGGRTVEPITANDLNSPGGRGLMQDVNNLRDKRRALAAQDDIATRPGVTPKRARQAQMTAARLRKDIAKLEANIGLTDGAARKRIDRTGKLIAETGSKEANQYIKSLNRMVEVRHMDRSTFRRLRGTDVGVVVDQGGMAYMSTPFGDIPLAPDELAELTRHTFENGDTTLDRWMKHINADARNPKRTEEGIIENARKRTMADLRDDFAKRFPEKKPNIIMRNWERYSTYLRNQILGSWISAVRYWSNTYFGNLANLFLGGYWMDAWKVGDAKKFLRLYKDDAIKAGKAAGADPFDYNPNILELDRIANQFGTSRAPELRRQVRTETNTSIETPIEDWATRHGVPKPVKEVMRGVTGDSRVMRWAMAGDTVQRDIVGSSAFYREIKPAIKDFKAEAKVRLTDTGMVSERADAVIDEFTKAHPTGFTSSDVYEYFHDYFPDGIAERLSRDWQSAVNRVEKNARAEIQRVTFAGRETKVDVALRNFVMFNFFMSRQYGFLMKQGLRHPGLINAYINYTEFAQNYLEENPDLPTWAKGMIRVTGLGPQGWALMLNPTALWAMGNLSFGGEEGAITLESIWDAVTNPIETAKNFDRESFEEFFYNNQWIFIHPGITSALNLAGYLGDQRAFDPLNMNTWGRFWALGENWLRYKGWLGDEGIVGNPVADTGNQIRDWVSGMLLDWAPFSEHVAFSESVGREEQEMRAIAWDLAIQQGKDPENNIEDRQWLDEQMMDPTSEMYKEAFRRYLNGETANLGAKLIPLISAMQPFGRYQDRDGNDLMESVTRADGLSEFKQFVRTNDPDARMLDLAADRYFELKDDHPYANNDLYSEIAYGVADHPVIIDGRVYQPDEINAMSPDMRVDLAKAWLAEEGVYQYWQEWQDAEDQFLADPENRAYAQNKAWERGVYDYPGGVEGYWQELIKHNPNARRFYEGLDPNLTESERIDALTSRQAFMAVAGFQRNIYEPEPLDTNFYDPLDIANKAPQPTPYEPYEPEWHKETRQQVEQWERDMTKADPVVRRILSDWGLSPDTPLNQLPYRVRLDVVDEYKYRTGESLPYEKWDSYSDANRYFEWAAVQPVGADTSLDAYFEQAEEKYVAGLPEDFNAQYTSEEDDVSAYDWYDRFRTKDPGYRFEDED